MTLYVRENCSACEAVKAYISTREDLKDIIQIRQEIQAFSPTYPTLVIDDSDASYEIVWLVITKAANIINFLKTLQVK